MVVYISEENIARFNKNPYIEKASEKIVKFTPEFMQYATEKMRAGLTVDEVLESIDIDPWILGDSRVYGLRMRIQREAKQAGFDLGLETRVARADASLARIRELEHEVEYLRQEQEFIKKILTAANEASEK